MGDDGSTILSVLARFLFSSTLSVGCRWKRADLSL
jgi:hypothetical protein